MPVRTTEDRALKAESRRLFAEAIESLHRAGTGDVVFGGMVEEGAVSVDAVAGGSKNRLGQLIVDSGKGLGGRAMTEGTPQLTRDYGVDPYITHHYDEEILGEGIHVLVAVPTLYGGEVTGMVYCGHRNGFDVAAPHTGNLVRRVRQLSEDLGRLGPPITAATTAQPAQLHSDLDAASREALRHTYAELRAIRSGVADDQTRDRLAAVESRLADILSAHGSGRDPVASSSVRLSPREVDILSHVALGWPNGRIAEALGLRESTVKSYLNTVMAKLGARTRHEAVSRARAGGVLP